ncbi:MAG: hypothetical protein MUC99_08500 [Anaerolineae bacterium]|jgi:hypothetical protein|nr:hypothetical protein [Anaerolineae bacterium]
MTPFERVLALIETLTPEEREQVRERLAVAPASPSDEATERPAPKRQLGTLAHRGPIIRSEDFDESLEGEFGIEPKA